MPASVKPFYKSWLINAVRGRQKHKRLFYHSYVFSREILILLIDKSVSERLPTRMFMAGEYENQDQSSGRFSDGNEHVPAVRKLGESPVTRASSGAVSDRGA